MLNTSSLHNSLALAFASALLLVSCAEPSSTEATNDSENTGITVSATPAPEPLQMPELPDSLDRGYEEEVHFDNVRQLTYGGDNAEAYWSFDGRSLVFQATNPGWGTECDQIYVMDLADGTPPSTPPPCQYRIGPHHLRLLYAGRHHCTLRFDPRG